MEVKAEKALENWMCGAKAKSTGEPCRQKAIEKTGRCKYHGGLSTGPKDKSKMKGNKNAVKTGEHEMIYKDTLAEDELQLFEVINTDTLEQVNEEIKLLSIRERRMLQRIDGLKKETYHVASITQTTGLVNGKPIDNQVIVSESNLIQIQNIEEALTRVQEKKAKLLDLKHKIETVQSNTDKPDISKFFEALGTVASEAWSNEESTSDSV